MKNLIILGGGTSVHDIDVTKLQDFGYVIGVNDSALYAPVDECVSMDRLWFENRWDKIDEKIPLFMRRNAIKNPHQRKNLQLFDNNHKLAVMSDDPNTYNGTNSGMVAINRAYHLRPNNVFLLGFDMHRNVRDGAAYWYPPYPWAKPRGATGEARYIEWSMQFAAIRYQFWARKINIYNVGITSLIHSLPKITTKAFMRLVNEV